MDRKQSTALFQRGKEAWNAWASELLAEQKILNEAGRRSEFASTNRLSQEAKNWQENARVDFSGMNFNSGVNFKDFIFPGIAEFSDVTFSGITRFDGVKFAGEALFCRVKFSNDAWFRNVVFSQSARFDDVEFSGVASFEEAKFSRISQFQRSAFSNDAWFRRAEFLDVAWFEGAKFSDITQFGEVKFCSVVSFSQCNFNGATFFNDAIFSNAAEFNAIKSKSVFSLSSTRFLKVPNFIQAHFAEAPRLDDLEVPSTGFWSSRAQFIKNERKPDQEIAARWRALKRLAIQGHDHQNEQLFFRSELLARQWHSIKPWHAAFWFSVIYQLLSDFGGSLLRPLGWWFLSLFVFTGVYLAGHPDIASGDRSTFGAVYERIAPRGTTPIPLTCRSGSSDPVLAALDLSVRNALLFVGQTSRDELQKNYQCLYAKRTEPLLTVPKAFIFWGHLQNVLSVLLIFLFLLGVRNHFKIR